MSIIVPFSVPSFSVKLLIMGSVDLMTEDIPDVKRDV